MTAYKKLNIITGWIVFGIAAFTYLSTIEPTASFWDCGEYIATSYKLEVGHPPGAPLFNMIARVFTLFGDKQHAAALVNSMSALCSAATILFLFWSITLLARKLYPRNKELSTGEMWAIMGAGAVGALAYTFSDSFWFSAVEGEVYAMSSMFTAAVFWAMLRWEAVADEPQADRWLILAFYLIGLSIGVHLLSLLTIPAMVFIYYFKRYKVTRKGFIITTVVSVFLLGFVQSFLIPWVVKLAALFELFFVNNLHMPFNSGTIAYFLVLIGGIVLGVRYSHLKNLPFVNTAIISFACLVLGYSSFLVLVIRANANTPMNQNRPTDALGLLSYLNRDQYGDWPLLYGPYYTAKLVKDQDKAYSDGTPLYKKDAKAGKYVVVDQRDKTKPNYDSRYCTVFPRMYDGDASKASAYKRWGKVKERTYYMPDEHGQYDSIVKPSFGENMTYFWNYQIWHMYARYFLWNFAGKQNDAEGFGTKVDGNWLSGIGFIDDWRLGDQRRVPAVMKQNKARNELYFLPLILGLLGIWFHFRK
ncbi:MAG TPA: DUF2723 domain-containing protein, partial [Bacteroidia bacterium]|nr:DUF2723 domain-containing protein [Bacteroidia bacterium]